MAKRDYAAFISYAHADEAVAAKLHRAIETYHLPKALKNDPDKIVKPVFRDVAELTAHHSLSEKIRDAVQRARFLIVLCSPAAKASHWVNEEIYLFRKLHGEGSVLSILVEGTPETSFPPALTEDGREPLAANLNMDKAGFRFGVTQIVAAMVGTGLDALIQRDVKRRNRRLQIGLAASLALSAFMGYATWSAIDARNEAQTSRDNAEELVEYMIGDLRQDLEGVGRLDIQQGVGAKIITYYKGQDLSDISDDGLALLARAHHDQGKVAIDAGRFDDAKAEFETASAITGEVLRRNPDNTNAIFAHAQSEFWYGEYFKKIGQIKETELRWESYYRLAQELLAIAPDNPDFILEAGYGANNLGNVFLGQSLYDKAEAHFNEAVGFYDRVLTRRDNDSSVLSSKANSLSGLSEALLSRGNVKGAQNTKRLQIETYERLRRANPDDFRTLGKLVSAQTHFLRQFRAEIPDEDRAKLAREIDRYFDALVQRDPRNTNWRKNQYRSLYDLSVQQGFGSAFGEKFSDVKTLYFQSNVQTRLDEFYWDDFTLARTASKARTAAYHDKLREIVDKYGDSEAQIIEESLIDIYLATRLFEAGFYDDSKFFARRFSDYSWIKNEKNQFPGVVDFRDRAAEILAFTEAGKGL